MNAERKSLLAKRDGLKTPEKDGEIARIFLSSPLLNAEKFFVYYAVNGEVSTQEIIEKLMERGKAVCLPFTQKDGTMSAVSYRGELVHGVYGIPTPPYGADEPCAVVFAPLLAADLAGNRIGYGGGYYDRYFRAHPNAVRVGLCYGEQVVAKIIPNAWDEPLDYLLTERGIVRCKNERKAPSFWNEDLT